MADAEIIELLKSRISGASIEEASQAIIIPKDSILTAARLLMDSDFDNLHCVTAVDKKDNIELVYYFCSMQKHQSITLKVCLPISPSPSPLPRGEDTDEGTKIIDNLEVESLTGYWKSADWLEREVYDLFGVKFLNHPNLKRILNPDDWNVHPLRKDFERPDVVKKPRY